MVGSGVGLMPGTNVSAGVAAEGVAVDAGVVVVELVVEELDVSSAL